MRVLISSILQKELSKIFPSRSVSQTFLKKMLSTNPEMMYLKRPYVKIKVSLFSTSFRIVGNYIPENQLLILLFVAKKTDKVFWENIMWNKTQENKIIQRNNKVSDEIESWGYEIFE